MTVFVAVTGASGAIYADRAIRALAEHGVETWATLTPTAADIVRHELSLAPGDLGGADARVTWFACDDLSAPPASGSSCADAMLVVPCSMGTLGRIAGGAADTLIARAADVCLKERKPLVLVPREMPLNLIHLRNMTALTEAGAILLPASPHFYDRPASIEELVATVVGRALVHLGVPNVDQPRWSAPPDR
ncbi:MAG: UbiX family flavin prenyltransferase [Armatimonadetes bacterium]|nr:UbiX family flavin prenyltransferase [Armatimonadota bacterium]